MNSGARPLVNGELARVSTALPSQRDRCLLYLGCGTGFRIDELLSIEVHQVKNADGPVRQSLQVGRGKMKGKKRSRSCPIPKQAQQHIALWLAEHPDPKPTSPLFPSRKKKAGKLQAIGQRQALRILKDAAAAAGIDPDRISTHTLRKTFADRVFTNTGDNVFDTQQALGHRSPASTISYLSFREKRVEDAIRGIFDGDPQMQLPLQDSAAEEKAAYKPTKKKSSRRKRRKDQ